MHIAREASMSPVSTLSCLEKTASSARLAPLRCARRDVSTAALRRPTSHQPHKTPKSLSVHYAQTPIDAPRRPIETVGEVMTAGVIYTVSPDTPVIEALELVVDKRITGMPVIDRDRKVVGVVSDFDLLAVDLEQGRRPANIFPSLDQSWEVFHDLQNMIAKSEGKIVEDVMTDDPVVVRAETSLNSAARLLVEMKMRRLPVVDREGILIGLLTRRDIVTAALSARRQHPEYFAADDEVFDKVSYT